MSLSLRNRPVLELLEESQLLSILHVTTTGRAGILFDLRTGLWQTSSNVGLLLLDGVDGYSWDRRDRRASLTAASVVKALVTVDSSGQRRLAVSLSPWAGIDIALTNGRLVVGTAEGIGHTPPD